MASEHPEDIKRRACETELQVRALLQATKIERNGATALALLAIATETFSATDMPRDMFLAYCAGFFDTAKQLHREAEDPPQDS
jgi:hypothetical protein